MATKAWIESRWGGMSLRLGRTGSVSVHYDSGVRGDPGGYRFTLNGARGIKLYPTQAEAKAAAIGAARREAQAVLADLDSLP
jgi:hypothetical protein